MKITWKTELPFLALIAAMFVLAAVTWSDTPERIPVHWGMDGQPDRYGGRFEGLLLEPLIAVLVYFLMLLMPRLDPGRMNYARFAGAYYTIRVTAIAAMAVLYGAIHMTSRGVPLDTSRLLGLTLGGTIFVIGNVLGKIRPNWFVGVRTPWTLSSKRSWTRTHRLAGWIFVVGGILLIAAGALQSRPLFVTAFAVMAAGTLWAVVYSYLIWRSDPDRVPPAGTLPSNGEA